jgi:membrane protease YdiL (CAAX protease family)
LETVAFLIVAISSTGKLKNLGLEFANWNPLSSQAAAECIVAGVVTGGAIVGVAILSGQPLGAEVGWNKALLAIVLGPVAEEVIFRGYLMTGALVLARRLISSNYAAYSVVGVAVPFSIAHLTTDGITVIQLCCIASTGCLYGFLRLRHRSTVASTLAHAVYNLALYVSYWCGWAS